MERKNNKNDDNQLLIPFNRAVRVGNFKLWRGRMSVGTGKDKTGIETVNVSNLDGTWKVQIPSTSQMFGFICQQYATVDTEKRNEFLGMVFTNMLNVNLLPSPALHDAFFFLTEMMTFPYMLLSEKEMESRMRDGLKASGMDKQKIKQHIGRMMDYRRQLYELLERKKASYIEEYERQQAERREKEEEAQKALEQDDIAEQAMEALDKEEDEDID